MTFSAYDGETAGIFDLLGQLDVGTTARHIGGDCDHSLLTGMSNNLSLLLMELGIEHIMGYMTHSEHSAQKFGYFH